MKYQISFSKRFKKSFKKLTLAEKQLFYSKLKLLINNYQHPSLRTRKIQGTELLYESSINMSIRIIWHFLEDELIVMIDIGHHDILRRL